VASCVSLTCRSGLKRTLVVSTWVARPSPSDGGSGSAPTNTSMSEKGRPVSPRRSPLCVGCGKGRQRRRRQRTPRSDRYKAFGRRDGGGFLCGIRRRRRVWVEIWGYQVS
jgi:hypothetical protein